MKQVAELVEKQGSVVIRINVGAKGEEGSVSYACNT
jgi:hypothetical protein